MTSNIHIPERNRTKNELMAIKWNIAYDARAHSLKLKIHIVELIEK